MTDEELLREIGEAGDALWDDALAEVDKYSYIFINDPVPQDVGPLMVIPTLLLYFVALVIWAWERHRARRRRVSYFCPVCHNPMGEPLVYCPHCRRVQSRLRPAPGGVFHRVCPGCGKQSWSILGQYGHHRPKPLVCRDTDSVKGCYRPHRLPHLAGHHRSRHVALIGSTVAAKHVAMAHMFIRLVDQARPGRGRYQPGWKLTELELQLCRQVLYKGYGLDTAAYERPGRDYGLARTFILKAPDKTLLVFHNLLNDWLAAEKTIFENGLAWDYLDSLILVLDGDHLGEVTPPPGGPPVEMYSRLLRVIERHCDVDVGSRLSLKVAVAVTFSTPDAEARHMNGARSRTPESMQELVLRDDPALHALLQRSVLPCNLRFWGGVLPPALDFPKTHWIEELINWIMY